MSTFRVIATMVAVSACAAEELPDTDQVSQHIGQTWYVAPEPIGSASGNGSLATPWTLAHASTCAGGLIHPGDRVIVANGTYWGNFEMRCSGTAAQPITYVAATRHRAVIDGAIREFATPMASAWEPYAIDASKTVFRSTATYASVAKHYVGFIMLPTGPLTLIVHGQYTGAGHTGLANLTSLEHDWKPEPTPRYVGPGIAYGVDGRIYIRLNPSRPSSQRNRAVLAPSDPDPRRQKIYLAPIESVGVLIKASHVVFDGLTIATAGSAIITDTGVDDVVFQNLNVRPGWFGARLGGATNVKFLDSTFDARMQSSTFSASEMDVKADAPAAEKTRKVAIDLGSASNVTISRCQFNDFHDGILSNANDPTTGTTAAHHIALTRNTFRGTWDDGWQLAYGVHNVDISYNKFLGAGVSRDTTGSATAIPPQYRGTVWIHHNVFDPNRYQIWWYRGGADVALPPNVEADGMIDGIPLSSHGQISDNRFGFPYKLYYNTFVVREPKDFSVSIGTIGEYASLAASSTNPNVLVPTLYSGTPHEVYNNIFVDKSGFTPGPTYWITGQVINGVLEGRERYDGNVYSGWSSTSARPIYRYVRTASGALFASPDGQGYRTPEQLRAELAILNETKQYPIPSFSTLRRGWEKMGLSRLSLVAFDSCYRPTNCPECQSGAVSLVGSGWPGTATAEPARGAVQPTGCL